MDPDDAEAEVEDETRTLAEGAMSPQAVRQHESEFAAHETGLNLAHLEDADSVLLAARHDAVADVPARCPLRVRPFDEPLERSGVGRRCPHEAGDLG